MKRALLILPCVAVFGVGWIALLNHIADRVLPAARFREEDRARAEALSSAAPLEDYRYGHWRLAVYGAENCEWVRGHERGGVWVNGYWRRKPQGPSQKPQ